MKHCVATTEATLLLRLLTEPASCLKARRGGQAPTGPRKLDVSVDDLIALNKSSISLMADLRTEFPGPEKRVVRVYWTAW